MDMRPGKPTGSIPLWLYWLQIAKQYADRAIDERKPEAPIYRNVDGISVGYDRRGNEEIAYAMIAISASASALDGIYGSITDLLAGGMPQRKKGSRRSASRPHQILEGLKHGFKIGKQAPTWLKDLDWLFGIRDGIVHHGERLRPAVVVETTKDNVFMSVVEGYNLTARSAERAASLAREIIVTCAANPKPPLEVWSTRASNLLSSLGSIGPGTPPDEPAPEITVAPEGTSPEGVRLRITAKRGSRTSNPEPSPD